jgi:hypothetical protein
MDKTMKRFFFNIVFMMTFVVYPLLGQKAIWKIDNTQFVPLDSNYGISLLLSNTLSSYKQVNFYVLADEGLNLNSCELQTREWNRILEINDANYPGYFGKSYRIELPLYSAYRDVSANSKLLLELNAPYIKRTEIAYAFEFVDSENNVKRVSSFDTESEFEYLPITEIEFYTDEKKDNKSLLLPSSSNLSISPQIDELYSDLLISYWARIGAESMFYFNLVEKDLKDTLIQLNLESEGYLSVPSQNLHVNLENIFVGRSGWTHFSILVNSQEKTFDIFLNGKESFSIPSFNVEPKNLELSFQNKGSNKVVLDNIYVMDFGNNKSAIKRNMNYSRFISDSSNIIHFFNFENDDINSEKFNDVLKISSGFEKPRVVIDNPPLFSRVPEINFQSFESFSEITWRNSDDLSVESYSLEKSIDGSRYIEVMAKDSDNDPNKYYSIIDEKNDDDEVIYYRIRQLNKDGSQLFSAALKIGQAITQSFILEQNYPNPFNPLTKITIEVLFDSEFNIVVYDLVGNEINRIHSGYLSEGIHEFSFDGTDLPSGIYFMEASSQYSTQAIKMILAK